MADSTVTEPFPIFLTAHRYLLYDVNTVTYVRREHNITGVLIGGLPQAPQQNVFLGMPLELMPEEARLLVEKEVAYIVDDVAAHKKNLLSANGTEAGLSAEEKKAFMRSLKERGIDAAKLQQKKAGERKIEGLKKMAAKQGAAAGMENWNDIPDDMFAPSARRAGGKKAKRGRASAAPTPPPERAGDTTGAEEESLFGAPPSNPPPASETSTDLASKTEEALHITPATSYPPLAVSAPDPPLPPPQVPSSYPLFKHLHEKEYFLAPGLRFGCQYMAYPGDPLRFHSHFLVNGMDWDEEFELLDLVGGGRLGTGVKKGFLIGGEERKGEKNGGRGDVRAFCVEWGGM